MILADIWHFLTTSRYTRQLERENEELRAELKNLKAENHALIFALRRTPTEAETETEGTVNAAPLPRRGRPGRFQGFSQIKRQLESQEPPIRRTQS